MPRGNAAMKILYPLAKSRPNGYILGSQRGKLTVGTLGAAVKRARRRAAPDLSLDHVMPHCFRGLFFSSINQG